MLVFDKPFLEEALKILKDTADKKATMDILRTVKVEPNHETGLVCFTATDLEAGATACLSSLEEISQDVGTFCVPAKEIYNIVKSFPSDRIILQKEETRLIVKDNSESVVYNLATMDASEFPNLPNFSDVEDSLIEISTDALYQLITKTMFAVSKEEAKFVLGGVYFEPLPEEGKLRAVASDGHRLAYQDVEVEQDGKNLEQGFILPRKACKHILDAIKGKLGSVRFGFIHNHAVFKVSNLFYFSRVIEGNFPDYRSVLPQDFKTSLTIDRLKLMDALKRVCIVMSQVFKPVTFKLENGEVELFSAATEGEIGNARIKLDVVPNGEPMEITLNGVYLLDALSVMKSDVVELKFNEGRSPAILEGAADEGFLCLIMPMVL